jgi:hypothetical protein
MISIICVYNNRNIFKTHFLKSLDNQAVEFELIGLDNTKYQYRSAAEALNYGGGIAKGKYIMFAHQDISLLTEDWLYKAECLLDKIPKIGIAGVAGICKPKYKILRVSTVPEECRVGMVYHGKNKTSWNHDKQFYDPVEVQTIDEQLLIIPKTVFQNLNFDSGTCSNWHLYGVDYSLSVKYFNLGSFVLPLPVWHLSTGSIDKDYFITLKKIFKKHKSYKRIYTSCGFWHTNNFLNILELSMMAIKSQIGRCLGFNNTRLTPYIQKIKSLL